MKKSLAGAVVALSIVGLAACTEEAKAAEVAVFGSVEQRVEIQDGVSDVVNDDTFVGIRASEQFGETGTSAFAVISLDIDTEGANGSTTRDAYVGLDMGSFAVQAGRFESLTTSVADGTVDIFEGNTVDTIDDGRASNSVRATVGVDAFNVSAQITSDGTAGEKTVDTQALGIATEFAGVSLNGVYTKDNVNSTDSYLAAAGVEVAGINLAGAFERVDNGSTTTDTMIAAASLDVGSNTLRGGYEKADGDKAHYVAEVAHNFSKNTSAYANYFVDSDDAVEDTIGLGLRMNF